MLLIGAGISNLTLARLFAEQGSSVSILDRKDHIGGNCFDYFDENSIDNKFIELLEIYEDSLRFFY